jgi:hypothetical protein
MSDAASASSQRILEPIESVPQVLFGLEAMTIALGG